MLRYPSIRSSHSTLSADQKMILYHRYYKIIIGGWLDGVEVANLHSPVGLTNAMS